MGKHLQVTNTSKLLLIFFLLEFLKEPNMKLLALLLIATVFVCATSEEKKSDAEKKEALKNLVQDKKRAKDLDGVKRLARYYTGYYPTTRSSCGWSGSYCRYSGECCGSLQCRWHRCSHSHQTTNWEEPVTTRPYVSLEQYKENKEEQESQEDRREDWEESNGKKEELIINVIFTERCF